ncbi:ATP-binding protein, partial [Romboutsia sp. 1001216sp1]
MESLTKDSLSELLNEPTFEKFDLFLKENAGESNSIDFKGEWIDFHKLAKIILGIANYGGGCIVIGVDENDNGLEANGIKEKIIDHADFTKKIAKFFPEGLLDNIQLKNFFYCSDIYAPPLKDKKFQVIFIRVNTEDLPIICEDNGSGIEKGAIYFRRGTSTEKINYDELQNLITRKVEAISSKIDNQALKEELDQLKVLNDAIPSSISKYGFSSLKQSNISLSILGKEQNKIYPEKSFEEFLVDMI